MTEDWDWRLLWAASPHMQWPAAALRNWLNLFWLKDWDWPFLYGYPSTNNFLTPMNFEFNSYEILTHTHHCLPVYTSASCNTVLLFYTAGTFGSAKSQLAPISERSFWKGYLVPKKKENWKILGGIRKCIVYPQTFPDRIIRITNN